MPSKPETRLAEELKRHGLDLVEVLRDTNAETALRAGFISRARVLVSLRSGIHFQVGQSVRQSF